MKLTKKRFSILALIIFGQTAFGAPAPNCNSAEATLAGVWSSTRVYCVQEKYGFISQLPEVQEVVLQYDGHRAMLNVWDDPWSNAIISGERFTQITTDLASGRAEGGQCYLRVTVWDAPTPWLTYKIGKDRNHAELQILAQDGGNRCGRGAVMKAEMVRFTPACSPTSKNSVICAGNTTIVGPVPSGPEGIVHEAGNPKLILPVPKLSSGDEISLTGENDLHVWVKYASHTCIPDTNYGDESRPGECTLGLQDDAEIDVRLVGRMGGAWKAKVLTVANGDLYKTGYCAIGATVILPDSLIKDRYKMNSLQILRLEPAPHFGNSCDSK